MKRFTFTTICQTSTHRFMQAVALGVLLAVTGGGSVSATRNQTRYDQQTSTTYAVTVPNVPEGGEGCVEGTERDGYG